MRDRDTMRGRQATEVMALHRAGEALADGGARYVDRLAGLEHVHFDLGAGRQISALVRGQAKFDKRLTRGNVGLRVVTGNSLRVQLRSAGTVRDLYGAIAVLVLRLHLRDAVRENLDDGDRYCFTGVREHARHADLTADQSDSHVLFPQHTLTRCDWRLSLFMRSAQHLSSFAK